MIDDGSIDTLERPKKKERLSEATRAEDQFQNTSALPFSEGAESSADSAGCSGDEAERTETFLQTIGGNFTRNLKSARTVLGNRRARKRVGVPDVPVFIRPQNIAAMLIAFCGLALVLLDHSSPLWVKGLPSAYHNVFNIITDVGKSDWILIPTGLWILAMVFRGWQHLPFRRKMAVSYTTIYGGYLFFVVAVSGLLAIALKWNIGRARPKLFDEVGPLGFDLFAWQSQFSSFPSGHSTTAGALIVALALIFPKMRWLLIVVGVWIGASRIFVGAHYPSDVVAGLVVGGLFSYYIARWMARRRLGFRFGKNGQILTNMGSRSFKLCLNAFINSGDMRRFAARGTSDIS